MTVISSVCGYLRHKWGVTLITHQCYLIQGATTLLVATESSLMGGGTGLAEPATTRLPVCKSTRCFGTCAHRGSDYISPSPHLIWGSGFTRLDKTVDRLECWHIATVVRQYCSHLVYSDWSQAPPIAHMQLKNTSPVLLSCPNTWPLNWENLSSMPSRTWCMEMRLFVTYVLSLEWLLCAKEGDITQLGLWQNIKNVQGI